MPLSSTPTCASDQVRLSISFNDRKGPKDQEIHGVTSSVKRPKDSQEVRQVDQERYNATDLISGCRSVSRFGGHWRTNVTTREFSGGITQFEIESDGLLRTLSGRHKQRTKVCDFQGARHRWRPYRGANIGHWFEFWTSEQLS